MYLGGNSVVLLRSSGGDKTGKCGCKPHLARGVFFVGICANKWRERGDHVNDKINLVSVKSSNKLYQTISHENLHISLLDVNDKENIMHYSSERDIKNKALRFKKFQPVDHDGKPKQKPMECQWELIIRQ